MTGSRFLSRVSAHAAVVTALIALTVPPMATSAHANPVVRSDGPAVRVAPGDITDFSSAGRRHHRGRGGDAAALAAFAGIVGTIGAIAASRSYDDHYYRGGPGYYDGGPAYYGGGPGYGYGGPPRYRGTGPAYGYEGLGGF